LVQQYRLQGEAFVPGYHKILSYGGSEKPMKILQEAGLDVSSEAFWQGGFELLASLIAELTQAK
jgi:oligoendopeptidase F